MAVVYLGDSVYYDEEEKCLFTDNGVGRQNCIYMQDVLPKFLRTIAQGRPALYMLPVTKQMLIDFT